MIHPTTFFNFTLLTLFFGIFVGSVATAFAILAPSRGPAAPPPGSKGTK